VCRTLCVEGRRLGRLRGIGLDGSAVKEWNRGLRTATCCHDFYDGGSRRWDYCFGNKDLWYGVSLIQYHFLGLRTFSVRVAVTVVASMVTVDRNILVSVALTVAVMVDVEADTMQLHAFVISGHGKCSRPLGAS
jgi:hypothetical protein